MSDRVRRPGERARRVASAAAILGIALLTGCTYLQEVRHQHSGGRAKAEARSESRIAAANAENDHLKALVQANGAELRKLDAEIAAARKALADDKAATGRYRRARQDAEASLASLDERIEQARQQQASAKGNPPEAAEQTRQLEALTQRRDALKKALEQSLKP